MVCLLILLAAGCERVWYAPAKATRPYPHHLHKANAIDMQVFREGDALQIVNSTPRSYRDFDLWINQRYVRRVDVLLVGDTVQISLWDFYDQWGEAFNAGGFWRTDEPMPVRLVQMQLGEDQPLIGLVMIRAEEIK